MDLWVCLSSAIKSPMKLTMVFLKELCKINKQSIKVCDLTHMPEAITCQMKVMNVTIFSCPFVIPPVSPHAITDLSL